MTTQNWHSVTLNTVDTVLLVQNIEQHSLNSNFRGDKPPLSYNR